VAGGGSEPLLDAPELLLVVPPELAAPPLLEPVLEPPLLLAPLLLPPLDEPLSPLPLLDPEAGGVPVPSEPELVER
jgi:hypothetical protein